MKALASALTVLGCAGKTTSLLPVSRPWMTPCCAICSCVCPSPKGRLPNSIWKKITPRLHTSTLLLMRGRPGSKHSGGRYQYVPAPWLVSSREEVASLLLPLSPRILASPKSVTFTRRRSSNNMLAGLRS